MSSQKYYPGSKILLLKSGTGSGKSVTLGPEIYLNFPAFANKFIAITQPRILTTLEITNTIKEVYENKMIRIFAGTKDFQMTVFKRTVESSL